MNRVGLWILVALVYAASARVGQTVAIDPGNVTPVWLPSGIMLIWALNRGWAIAPGVFLGAFLGNGWAYFDFSSPERLLLTLLSAGMNGAGDVASTVGMASLIRAYARPNALFLSYKAVAAFVLLGVLFGALISAVVGVTGLFVADLITREMYAYVLSTWWTGDAIGVACLGPFIYALTNFRPSAKLDRTKLEAALALAAFAMTVAVLIKFDERALIPQFGQFFIPLLLLVCVLRFDLFFSTLCVLLIAATAVAVTSLGIGPFASADPNVALIEVQLFLGTISIAALLIYAGKANNERLLLGLMESRDRLEQKVRQRTEELEKAKSEAERLAYIDELTGIPNRRTFFHRGSAEISRAERHGSALSLVMLDIDHFKKINDTYGHGDGDLVLKDLSETVSGELREYDLFGRVGGEEFSIILPSTGLSEAVGIAERIRLRLAERRVGPAGIPYTASFGVAALQTNEETIAELMKRADKALYRAKETGRNKVITD